MNNKIFPKEKHEMKKGKEETVHSASIPHVL